MKASISVAKTADEYDSRTRAIAFSVSFTSTLLTGEDLLGRCSFRERVQDRVARLRGNIWMDYVHSQKALLREPSFLQRTHGSLVLDITSRLHSIDRRRPQRDFHERGDGLRHKAISPIRPGKNVPDASAVPIRTYLYHSKQMPIFLACDDVRKRNRAHPSIFADGDEFLGCVDRGVRNPHKVSSDFTVLRVRLEYGFSIRRNRTAQMEP